MTKQELLNYLNGFNNLLITRGFDSFNSGNAVEFECTAMVQRTILQENLVDVLFQWDGAMRVSLKAA